MNEDRDGKMAATFRSSGTMSSGKPRAADPDAPADPAGHPPESRAGSPGGSQPGERQRILVVDDNPLNVQALYHTFSGDYQVFMATSGEAALDVCRERQPDLVLLDVVMPGLDGYETCERLKSDPETRDIPVIFVTGQDDSAAEVRGLAAGAVDFIVKPFNPVIVRARARAHLTLKRQADQLRELAYTDALTGVANRSCFDQRLAAEFTRSQRNGTPLALIMIDVDRFRQYNECYGHQAGDDCLRLIAAALRSRMRRAGDTLARHGGDAFACILPDTSTAGAFALAQELEQRVRDLNIPHAASDVATVCTISLGVAACSDMVDSTQILLALADAELYRARMNGHGRASSAAGDDAPPGAPGVPGDATAGSASGVR
jgi:diguanylate cyclase (GGDEF)-like protein